eukprot:2725038-Rhodomonas_salina.1
MMMPATTTTTKNTMVLFVGVDEFDDDGDDDVVDDDDQDDDDGNGIQGFTAPSVPFAHLFRTHPAFEGSFMTLFRGVHATSREGV